MVRIEKIGNFFEIWIYSVLLNVFVKSKHRYQNVMKLAIQKSPQNENMTNGLVTGSFQKKPFQYETPCN